jgi:pimeloyl-ACP methyl ester carboxylesterase
VERHRRDPPRRDVIIISQRGAGGSTPNLDCFEPRTSEPARARRRAVTEPQEREILLRCRADFDKRRIDLAMYSTPALADDVADLVKAMQLGKVNLYGISYGTRWALEIMRRHPGIVRSVVLDAVYPPQINGEQNEPEIVRTVFEQLYGECAADKLCRERNPDLAGNVRTVADPGRAHAARADVDPRGRPAADQARRRQALLVLLHMMRQGEAALVPEAVTALRRGDKRLISSSPRISRRMTAACSRPTRSSSAACSTPSNAARPWAGVDQKSPRARDPGGGIYSLTAQLSKLPAFCPVWRVPVAPPAERQPVTGADPDPADERQLRLADPGQLGARGGQAPAGGTSRHFPCPGPRRVEPGPVRGAPARRVRRRARSALALALSRRHAARTSRRRPSASGAAGRDGERKE